MLEQVALFASTAVSVASLAVIFIKPLRQRVFSHSQRKKEETERERQRICTDQCLLRSIMLDVYYRNAETKTLHQYEFENFSYLYHQYQCLGGNSFVNRIWEEIQDWTILT